VCTSNHKIVRLLYHIKWWWRLTTKLYLHSHVAIIYFKQQLEMELMWLISINCACTILCFFLICKSSGLFIEYFCKAFFLQDRACNATQPFHCWTCNLYTFVNAVPFRNICRHHASKYRSLVEIGANDLNRLISQLLASSNGRFLVWNKYPNSFLPGANLHQVP
jgi:hypothetical protein